jgi:HIRAN domain
VADCRGHRCWSPEAADYAWVASNRVAIRVQADVTTISERGFACLMNLFPRASQMTTTSKPKLSGESFRQHELRALDARIASDSRGRRTFMARLRPDPHNPHDPNAVAVVAADNNDHLGHLPRELAIIYQSPLLTRGGAEAPGMLCGGIGRKTSLGVWLDLTALNRALGIVPASASVWSNAVSAKLSVAGNSPHADMRVGTELDPHEQPLNLRFNRARRTERDLCELLGLARGLLAEPRPRSPVARESSASTATADGGGPRPFVEGPRASARG